MSSSPGPQDLLFTLAWLNHFELAVAKTAQTQLVGGEDVHRLMACAMAVIITSHQMLSDMGGSATVRDELGRFYEEIAGDGTTDETAPPSLAEMTIIMDMAATGFSLLEHRRLAVGEMGIDIPTDQVAGALLGVLTKAYRAGGAKTAGTLCRLLRPFSTRPCIR